MNQTADPGHDKSHQQTEMIGVQTEFDIEIADGKPRDGDLDDGRIVAVLGIQHHGQNERDHHSHNRDDRSKPRARLQKERDDRRREERQEQNFPC